MFTQFATACALVALALIRAGGAALWLYAAYMSVQYMNEPGIYSLLMDQIPSEERSSASAFTFFVTSACQALASVWMGAGIVRFGYSVMLLVAALFALVATAMFAKLSEQRSAFPHALRSVPS